jgi:hypothetical protein
MQTVTNLLGRIDVGSIAGLGPLLRSSKGLFALLGLVIFLLYGLSVGKTKALVSLLAIYVAYMLTVFFPFLPWLKSQIILPDQAPVLSVGLFAIFYILTFLLLSHSMMRHRLTLGEISITKVVFISIVQLGLLASITISLLPAEFGAKIFGVAYPYLAGQKALWLWAASSLLILPLMKAERRE